MPSDSNGVYTLPPSYFVQNGDTVLPVQHNPPMEDLAQAHTNRLMKDGRTVWTGDMKAGGFRVTNMGPGQSDSDAATVGQIGRKASFKTVAELIADTSLSYSTGPARVSAGDIIEAQGFRYEVAASDATDAHVETAGGVKLDVSIANGEAHLLAFGASEAATAAENQSALEKWLSCSVNNGSVLVAAPVRLNFASTFTLPGNQIVHWEGLELVKQFDGDGVVFAGGPAVIYSHGRLFVEKGAGGSGPAGSNGDPANTTEGTNPADVGIVISNRIMNFGEFVSWYNQGFGIELRSDDGNMNSARFGFLRPMFNGSHGLAGSGTRDDISLVSIRARCYGNWKSGLYIPDDFRARSWAEVVVAAEGNGVDGQSPEIYLGGAYDDATWILYGENQLNAAANIPEIEVGPNSEYITIVNLRPNRFANNSLKAWSIKAGQKRLLIGTNPIEDFVYAGSVSAGHQTRNISRLWKGSGEANLMERRIFGNGAMHFIPYAGGEARKYGFTGSGDLELWGAGASWFTRSANGSRWRVAVSDSGTLEVGPA